MKKVSNTHHMKKLLDNNRKESYFPDVKYFSKRFFIKFNKKKIPHTFDIC